MEEYDEEYDDNSWKRAAGSITFYGLVNIGASVRYLVFRLPALVSLVSGMVCTWC